MNNTNVNIIQTHIHAATDKYKNEGKNDNNNPYADIKAAAV